MEQELLDQVYGDLVSTCESYISNIVLKEDGAEQLQEDLFVSLVPFCELVKWRRYSQNGFSTELMPITITWESTDVHPLCIW